MTAAESQRGNGLGWTLLLAVAAALIGGWLFSEGAAAEYFGTFYSPDPDTPLTLRIPLILLAVSALAVISRRNGGHPFNFKRAVLIAIPIVALMGVALFGGGFARNALLLLPAIAILAAGLGLGLLFIRMLRLQDDDFLSSAEQIALAGSLGAGMLALLLFIAGSFGVLNVWLWRGVLLAIIVVGAGSLRRLWHRMANDAQRSREQHCGYTKAALLFSALWVLVHLPLAWSPPLEYDVLEYHLAAPAQYLRDGQISFLRENIYATFPQNGEMLMMLAMLTAGDKLSGLPGAHAVLLAFWALSMLSVYALARRMLRRENDEAFAPAAIAVLIFAIVPMNTKLASDFYVEHFQTGMHLAAILAAMIFLTSHNNRLLVLAGALAGLAAGMKYTALLLTLAPLLICSPMAAMKKDGVVAAIRTLLLLGLPAAVALFPWLLRNTVAALDPIFPLGIISCRRLAGLAPTIDPIDHLDLAIRSGPVSIEAFARSLRGMFSPLTTPDKWLDSVECGPHLLAFLTPLIANLRRKETLFLLAVVIIDVVCWFLFSHRLNRFFHCVLPLIAVLSAAGIAAIWKHRAPRIALAGIAAATIFVLGPLPMVVVWKYSRPETVLGQETIADAARAQYSQHGDGALFRTWQSINALPEGSRTLFIGDAQTFYLDQTPGYSVVFNISLLEKGLQQSNTVAELAAFLKDRGITHVYINYLEWFRLDTTYAVTIKTGKLEHAQFSTGTREALSTALNRRDFTGYFRAWPARNIHAYLRADEHRAALLQQFLDKHTDPLFQHGRNGSLRYELLRIK